MSTTAESLISYPIGRTAPFTLPEVYERALTRDRFTKVAMSDGRQAWFFHRHDDVRALLLHPALSSNRSDPGFPAISAGGKAAFRHFAPFLISLDGDQHQRVRRPLIPEFSMRRMREFRPRIEQIVDSAIADLTDAGPPADVVTHLSTVIPRRVIAELMGVTDEHLRRFYELAGRFLNRAATAQERDATALDMRKNMDALVAFKQQNPGPDVLSHEIQRQQREEGAVDAPSLASLAQLMLLAGHESTSEMITLGLLALLERPAERALLLREPQRFPAAVDELIRFFSVVEIGMARVATADFEFAGATIRSGDGVIASNVAANRDPATFGCPNDLVLDRAPNPHLAQGFGPHQCIGMNLASVELSVVYERFFRALPDVRLAASGDLPFKYDGLIFGLSSLPVTW